MVTAKLEKKLDTDSKEYAQLVDSCVDMGTEAALEAIDEMEAEMVEMQKVALDAMDNALGDNGNRDDSVARIVALVAKASITGNIAPKVDLDCEIESAKTGDPTMYLIYRTLSRLAGLQAYCDDYVHVRDILREAGSAKDLFKSDAQSVTFQEGVHGRSIGVYESNLPLNMFKYTVAHWIPILVASAVHANINNAIAARLTDIGEDGTDEFNSAGGNVFDAERLRHSSVTNAIRASADITKIFCRKTHAKLCEKVGVDDLSSIPGMYHHGGLVDNSIRLASAKLPDIIKELEELGKQQAK